MADRNESAQSHDDELQRCVELVQSRAIKLVVFDMDLTAVAKHSRGQLQRVHLDDYVANATPDFLSLVPKLYESGFLLAIATHSDEAEFGGFVQRETHILGNELARALVEKQFPAEIAAAFFIVAYNPRVQPEGEKMENKLKRYHFRELQSQFGVKQYEILFFDDSGDIIEDCRETCGIHAFQVDPKTGFCLEDLLDNF
jgi:FMN phosphatase YigB (HAD superfamily)